MLPSCCALQACATLRGPRRTTRSATTSPWSPATPAPTCSARWRPPGGSPPPIRWRASSTPRCGWCGCWSTAGPTPGSPAPCTARSEDDVVVPHQKRAGDSLTTRDPLPRPRPWRARRWAPTAGASGSSSRRAGTTARASGCRCRGQPAFDRVTAAFRIQAPVAQRAIAPGVLEKVDTLPYGHAVWHYRMDAPVPLAALAVASGPYRGALLDAGPLRRRVSAGRGLELRRAAAAAGALATGVGDGGVLRREGSAASPTPGWRTSRRRCVAAGRGAGDRAPPRGLVWAAGPRRLGRWRWRRRASGSGSRSLRRARQTAGSPTDWPGISPSLWRDRRAGHACGRPRRRTARRPRAASASRDHRRLGVLRRPRADSPTTACTGRASRADFVRAMSAAAGRDSTGSSSRPSIVRGERSAARAALLAARRLQGTFLPLRGQDRGGPGPDGGLRGRRRAGGRRSLRGRRPQAAGRSRSPSAPSARCGPRSRRTAERRLPARRLADATRRRRASG